MIRYSDRRVRHLSVRYTVKMANSGIIASLSTISDYYDNALAEAVKGLFKAYVIEYLEEQGHGVNDVELAMLK